MMTLTDHFRADVAGMSKDDRLLQTRVWHNAARRAICLNGFTSNEPPPFIVARKVYACGSDAYPVTIQPANARFFLNRSREELRDLYRATKPSRQAASAA